MSSSPETAEVEKKVLLSQLGIGESELPDDFSATKVKEYAAIVEVDGLLPHWAVNRYTVLLESESDGRTVELVEEHEFHFE